MTTHALEDAGRRTAKQFWQAQSYYTQPAAAPDPAMQKLFDRFLPKRGDWSALEVGACPGTNLLTLARSHGYRPVALDFLPEVQALPGCFRQYGVELEAIEHDFLTWQAGRRFHVVMSFGFIEHFDEPEPILRKHWELVEEGGFLILSLPIFGPLQMALRRLILTPEKLAEALRSHNTAMMDMRLFRAWSRQLPGAEVLKCGYAGNMHTWFYSSDPYVRRNRRWILWTWKIAAMVPRWLHVSCRWFSPYGLLVARRRPAGA